MHDARDTTADSPLIVWATARQGRHAFASRLLRTSLPVGWLITLGLLVFAAVWLSHLAYTSLSPPVDDIEQLTWVRSLEWGYYKHPPLPTWLMWLPVWLFGLSRWTAYIAGAACTLSALGLMWSLLARLRGTRYAAVALLAALCITYYNGRLYYYNHNIVLMLLSAASANLCWQAFATRQRRWWVGLGLAIGCGALSKYQIAVTIVCVLAFAWHQRAWRHPVHRLGMLLACLIALLLFAPTWPGCARMTSDRYDTQSTRRWEPTSDPPHASWNRCTGWSIRFSTAHFLRCCCWRQSASGPCQGARSPTMPAPRLRPLPHKDPTDPGCSC